MKRITTFLKIIGIGVALLAVLIAFFFGHSDKTVTELTPQYAPAPSAFIPVDSLNVHYRDEGNPADTLPVVLIHGTSSSLHTFNAWTEALKGQHRVVRLDLPGFGLTGPFVGHDYSIEHYVSFVRDFLAARGIKKCVLAGNSLGGQIAYRFTIQYPNLVDKLILIDAAGYPLVSQQIPIGFRIARIPVLNKLITFITPRSVVKASVENVYADKAKVTEALVDRYFNLTLRAGNRQALADRLTVPLDSSSLRLIKTIQQPTLVLWGEQDRLIPVSNAYRFHQDLPNDTLVILKNAGHVPMEESPTESLKAVLSFLKWH